MARKNRKEDIFYAAATLFRNKGYQASSMRLIAKKVGLEVSSLYSHISNKQELLSAICLEVAESFETQIEQIDSTASTVPEKLYQVVDYHVEMALTNPISYTVFNDEWKHLEDEAMREFKQKRKYYRDKLLSWIELGVKEGSIRKLEPQIVYRTLLSALKWVYNIKPNDQQSVERLKQDIKIILFEGIRN